MKFRFSTVWRLGLILFSAQAAYSQLDTDFGTGGKVISPIGSETDNLFAVALQGDGKIVAAGSARIGAATLIAVARYKPDGSLDSSFGTGGIVTTPIGASASGAAAVAILGDGKILVGGYTSAATLDFAALRYKPDGSLDSGFGAGGIAVVPVGAGNDVLRAMAVQADGKIVLAGRSVVATATHSALARLNPDGGRDSSFDGDGALTTEFAGVGSDFYAVAVQSDGKIVATGTAGPDVALARYASNGSPDSSFGAGGRARTDFLNSTDMGEALAIQPDGKILVAGQTQPAGPNAEDFGLMRYKADGTLDSSFGTHGIVSTDFDGDNDNPSSLLLLPDGKILVGGYSFVGTSFPDFALARYLGDGTLDSSFGAGGWLVTDLGAGTNTLNALALQGDGKIVAAGIYNAGAASDFALVRYSFGPVAVRGLGRESAGLRGYRASVPLFDARGRSLGLKARRWPAAVLLGR